MQDMRSHIDQRGVSKKALQSGAQGNSVKWRKGFQAYLAGIFMRLCLYDEIERPSACGIYAKSQQI
ncbi:hypothetical protein [Nitrosopumilus sp.]|uniref:hypothetical protein n=1 Tax=Nitrosopumilus sp. TaxID=2024843 RepID=UPI00247BB671|nr:hypothetical protein [Nitrosopumilus sp.]MCV0410163.1 hypothetical protein [Nitrosopumilus sp.]